MATQYTPETIARRQEIFNKVFLHLKNQGARSVDPACTRIYFPQCLYRNPNGLKCAIGVLIPDDKYEDRFEYGYYADNPIILQAAGLSGEDAEFAVDLQGAHDGITRNKDFMSQLIENMTSVAKEYQLDPAIMGNQLVKQDQKD